MTCPQIKQNKTMGKSQDPAASDQIPTSCFDVRHFNCFWHSPLYA